LQTISSNVKIKKDKTHINVKTKRKKTNTMAHATSKGYLLN